jgi:hypothetical protein
MWLWLISCVGDPEDKVSPEVPPPEVDWADIAPILSEHCTSCHSPTGVTGLPFTTWQEAHDARDIILFALQDGRMPPWPAAPSTFPFWDDPRLTPEELALVTRWVELDAPLGEGSPEPIPVVPPEVLPRVDARLYASGPYLPTAPDDGTASTDGTGLTDDYRCFLVHADSPVGGYIRGLQFAIGNSSAVHHAKLALVHALDGGAAIDTLEAEDPEPGWNCNGELGEEMGGPIERLGTWLPGTGPYVLPEGTGIPIDEQALFVMTVHYSLLSFDGQPDETHLELLLEPTVERPVEALRVLDPEWREGALVIPAGQQGVTFTYTMPLTADALVELDPAQGIEILSVQLHMHERGERGHVLLHRGQGVETLLDIPRWNFDWQLDYWLVEPVVLHTGAAIQVECAFDNSAGTEDVTWGESSQDEMCGTVMYVTSSRP